MLCDHIGILALGKYYIEKMGVLFFNQVVYMLNLQDCLFPLISEWFISKHPLAS